MPGKSVLLVWVSSFEYLLCIQEVCDNEDMSVAMSETDFSFFLPYP